MITAGEPSLTIVFKLHWGTTVGAPVDECGQLAVGVLNDNRNAANFVRQESVRRIKQRSKTDKYPEFAKNARLLKLK